MTIKIAFFPNRLIRTDIKKNKWQFFGSNLLPGIPGIWDLTICILVLMIPVFVTGQIKQKDGLWPEQTKTTKPWTRWWWMGSAVDQHNLRNLLKDYHSKGLGGVEVAPIYGAKGYEGRYIKYLSPRWRDMLQFTIREADSLGMGVDLTMGTGWPFGGPYVSKEDAASKLVTREYTLGPGEKITGKLTPEDTRQSESKLLAVLARSDQGKKMDLSKYVGEDHKLDWEPAQGTWKIQAFFNGKTGQKVKRAAPGGAGYVLNHYSKSSVDDYMGVYDSAFQGELPGIRAVYNDSYEVYGANWTKNFLAEYQKRRGYDLTPHLGELISGNSTDTIIRLRSDYRETLNELLLENFTLNWTTWAHQHGKISKNQAHGSPGNLLDLYGTVDIPECETFGSTYFPIPGLRRDSADIRNVDPDPIMLKFASSAAHVTGKNLVSSETFTWLGEHFTSSFSQMKPELEQVFLAGVNHMFYHGVTYSPEDVRWPGWLFYASLNLSSANSLWPHFGDFNQYVSRCQSILQAGDPDNDLLVYWPIYDVWGNQGDLLKMLTVHHIDEWLHPTSFYKWSKKLMDQGYLVDFISDQQVENTSANPSGINTQGKSTPYKTLIVPASRFLPLTTLEHLLKLANNGATIIFEQKPGDIPGLHNIDLRRKKMNQLWDRLKFKPIHHNETGIRLAKWGKGTIILSENILQGLGSQNIRREKLTDLGLGFIRRKSDHASYYFVVNHTAKNIDTLAPFNNNGESVILMDPLSGKTGLAENRVDQRTMYVKLQLQPGETIFVRFSDSSGLNIGKWKYRSGPATAKEIEGPWTLTFTEGGPKIPETYTLDQLKSWTDLDDQKAEYFSGQAIYETNFTVDVPATYILKLGNVRESAHVWINGRDAGFSWSIPYELDISEFVRQGENKLKIEVANLMANRIRYLDQEGISWRNYHEINFVNIDYKPFDASGWEPVRSGLMGPVRLVKYK